MQHHALNYLLKPVDREELAKVLWNAENIFKEKGNTNEDGFDRENASLTRASKNKMETALEYIHKNYKKAIDMAEVSNYVSMNYSMFSSTFKEYTGDNFSAYLRKIRIEKSKKLLEKTDLNINEIAQRVGFDDARRFAKVFKEECEDTPTNYRTRFPKK